MHGFYYMERKKYFDQFPTLPHSPHLPTRTNRQPTANENVNNQYQTRPKYDPCHIVFI